jgi:hypothetical protein
LNQKGKIMKAILLVLGTAALLSGGCATYYGGGTDDSGVVRGYDGSPDSTVYVVDPADPFYRVDAAYPAYPMHPVYKQGSPNGQDMGGDRPEVIFWR